ncbi:tetratricopeptide repeat protein [Streptomyces caniferus]|uniref:tetratricopeptide repeat protein n=1 Tax=Streptomyces caniferus TaxID=285557 RepID=UPI0033FDC7EF
MANVLTDTGGRQEAARLLRACLDGYRRAYGPATLWSARPPSASMRLRDHPA